MWSLDNTGFVLKELVRQTLDPCGRNSTWERMQLEEGALWRQDGSTLVQLVKLVSSLFSGPSHPMNNLCLIICKMYIKVDTPEYANEDYGDHTKHM